MDIAETNDFIVQQSFTAKRLVHTSTRYSTSKICSKTHQINTLQLHHISMASLLNHGYRIGFAWWQFVAIFRKQFKKGRHTEEQNMIKRNRRCVYAENVCCGWIVFRNYENWIGLSWTKWRPSGYLAFHIWIYWGLLQSAEKTFYIGAFMPLWLWKTEAETLRLTVSTFLGKIHSSKGLKRSLRQVKILTAEARPKSTISLVI